MGGEGISTIYGEALAQCDGFGLHARLDAGIAGLAANGEAGHASVEARVKAEAIALTKRFPMYE